MHNLVEFPSILDGLSDIRATTIKLTNNQHVFDIDTTIK